MLVRIFLFNKNDVYANFSTQGRSKMKSLSVNCAGNNYGSLQPSAELFFSLFLFFFGNRLSLKKPSWPIPVKPRAKQRASPTC